MCPAQRDTFLRPCVPCVNLLIVLHCRPLFLKGRKDVWTLLRDIFMCPAQRDTLTGHFFASLCPLGQFANCFALSATFPQGTELEGRLDFIAGHFYVSRSTRHSDGTLYSRPNVPF